MTCGWSRDNNCATRKSIHEVTKSPAGMIAAQDCLTSARLNQDILTNGIFQVYYLITRPILTLTLFDYIKYSSPPTSTELFRYSMLNAESQRSEYSSRLIIQKNYFRLVPASGRLLRRLKVFQNGKRCQRLEKLLS